MVKFTICIFPHKRNFNGVGKQRSGQNVLYGTYARLVNKSGVYYIRCKVNNKLYIGSSKDIGSRLIKHFSQLRKNNHPNHALLSDYKKYGQKEFEFGVVEYTDTDLKELESKYQNEHNIDELYNLSIKNGFHSAAQLCAWHKANRDSHKTKEYRDKMRAIKFNKIGQFDKKGKLIKVYANSDEVVAKLGMAKSTLLGCCNGSKRSVFGYVFHYLDDNGNIIANGKGRNRTIIKHSEDIV